jgi:hypothetical protein
MRSARAVAACVCLNTALAVLIAACTAIPRAELTAYTSAYSEILAITNGILDIVSPYERIVIRNAKTGAITIPTRMGAITFPSEARAQVPDPTLIAPRPSGPAPDPSLIAPSGAKKSPKASPAPDPSLIVPSSAKKTPKSAPAPDPSLILPSTAKKAPKTTPAPDQSLILPSTAKKTPKAAPPPDLTLVQPRRVLVPVEEPVVIPGPVRPTLVSFGRRCTGVGGPDPFCYETRDGYADIGDPPLVGAYRNLANVVLRFNTLLIAYADGITGRLLQQELAGLSSAVGDLSTVAATANIGAAAGFATSFNTIVASLAPIVTIAGGIYDRAQLRVFLLANYELVDEAIELMAKTSPELYANVAVGTELFRRASPPGTGGALLTRRKEIRRLIANWTVLMDDTRRLLRDVKVAIEHSDGLETRLHNLESTVRARIDTSSIKKQIATLGTPSLAP